MKYVIFLYFFTYLKLNHYIKIMYIFDMCFITYNSLVHILFIK